MSLKKPQIIRESIKNEWLHIYTEIWTNSELNPLSVIWNEDSDRGQLRILNVVGSSMWILRLWGSLTLYFWTYSPWYNFIIFFAI